MNSNLDEYRDEIDRLEDIADKLESLGMADKAENYKSLIEDLRQCFDKLERQLFWESDDAYN